MTTSRGHATRTRIAEAALEILREKGSSGLTMRQVAGRSGLALSNVQYHYGSREQLLVGLTEHHLAACRTALLTSLGDGSPSLRRVLEISLLDPRVRETVPPFRELFALALTEPRVRERLDAYYAASLQAFSELLTREFPRAVRPAEEVATVLMTALEGSYLLERSTPVSAERLVDVLEATGRMLLHETP